MALQDYIVPEVFTEYVVKRTNELSALYQSGIISHDKELDVLAKGGGKTINMPYWADLTGEDEVATYDGTVTPAGLQAGQDVACLLQRVKAWKAPDMQQALSGSDPTKAIGDMVSAFWARRMQAIVLKELEGVFGNVDMKGNIYEYTTFDKATAAQEILSGLYKLGDSHAKLTAVACNSVDALSIDLQSIASNNAQYITSYTEADKMAGRRIIVDDSIPAGTLYLFGEGAIGFGNGWMEKETEVTRDAMKGIGVDYLVSRRAFLLHPRGVKFTGATVTGITPSNAELATKGNWARVYDPKDIRIVKMIKKGTGPV